MNIGCSHVREVGAGGKVAPVEQIRDEFLQAVLGVILRRGVTHGLHDRLKRLEQKRTEFWIELRTEQNPTFVSSRMRAHTANTFT